MRLSDYEAVAEVEALLEENRQAQTEYMQRVRDMGEEHQAALEEHHAKVQKALVDGGPIPEEKPKPPIEQAEHHDALAHFDAQRTMLLGRLQEAKARIAHQVEEDARQVEQDVRDDVQQHLDALTESATRLREARDAVQDVRHAVFQRDVSVGKGGVRPEHMPNLMVVDLVAAVADRRPLVPVKPRRLGFQRTPEFEHREHRTAL